jgi:hypothetical protein
MNETQGRALCSMLTIIVVLLFIIVLYRVYQSLEKFEEQMNHERDLVKETESNIITTIKDVLKPEEQVHIEKLKQELNDLQQKNILVSNSNIIREEKEQFALQEEVTFHTNMINELEPFTGNNNSGILKTKINRMQELINNIEKKSTMAKESYGNIYVATVKLGNSDDAKRVKLLLQEYTIEKNPTNLYIIPEVRMDKYTMMCAKVLYKYDNNPDSPPKDYYIELKPCILYKKTEDMEPFLYKLNKNSDNGTYTIQPYITSNLDDNYRLVVEKDTPGDGHYIKLVKGDIDVLRQFDNFVLTHV